MAAGTDGTELHRLTNASELGPATPQRANMAALLASAQRSNEASSERTRTLLDQLSAANQTLAAQNTPLLSSYITRLGCICSSASSGPINA